MISSRELETYSKKLGPSQAQAIAHAGGILFLEFLLDVKSQIINFLLNTEYPFWL